MSEGSKIARHFRKFAIKTFDFNLLGCIIQLNNT